MNIADLRDHGVRIVHGDLRLAVDLDAIGPFDWVVDAAAEPSVLAGTGLGRGVGRRQLVDHNLLGTANLLEAAARWQAGFVMLSTSRVYSIAAMASVQLVERLGRGGQAFTIDDRFPLPEGASSAGFSEQFSTEAPVSLYGATKRAGEVLALEYAHAIGIPLVIDRCGVIAGSGQFGRADQGIFSWWIHRWVAGKPLAFIGFGGRGLQVRDCLHPADLGSLILMQIRAARGGDPVLMHASGGAASATSLAELTAWCTDRLGPQVVQCEPVGRPYDAPWIVLDHAEATRRFGWRPSRTAPEIFAEIADHAERNGDWLDSCEE